MHVNAVTIGDYAINKELGKKGSSTDITIYHRRIDDDVVTLIEPTKYPEKYQPLIKAMAYADAALINPLQIDAFLGEALITLELMGMRQVLVISNHDSLKKVANELGTNYKYLDAYGALEELRRLGPASLSNSPLVIIDQAFNVKSVGTVILGFIKGGKIGVHDKLKLQPKGIEVEVRSIQIQDVNYDEAELGTRVGLALKGVSADDIEEGDVLCIDCRASSMIRGHFNPNKYFKQGTQGQLHISMGSKIRPIKSMRLEQSTAYIEVDSPMPIVSSRAAVMKLDAKPPRIVGSIEIE
ncbi:MAG: hypothetical protein RXQ96_01135 [Thermocladium sp.]|jgi:selenocysteine-specific translation elongation factor